MRRVTPVFFFNDTATTEIYTLSLHDALPISRDVAGVGQHEERLVGVEGGGVAVQPRARLGGGLRSEEHTSELQSRQYLVCRLLLEKKQLYTSPALLTTIASLLSPQSSSSSAT